jgi:hypothetical protein
MHAACIVLFFSRFDISLIIKEMNNEIQANYIKELTAEKERQIIKLELEENQRLTEIEVKKKLKQTEAKLAASNRRIQQINDKVILSDNDLSDIASAFELRKDIPEETEKLRRALKADEEKIYSKSLAVWDNISKERLSLAITSFKILQMIEPGNHEYKTAIERLTDPSKLMEAAKANGFDVMSKYSQPLRDLAAISRS